MPLEMGTTVQSVVIGDSVYIGGGVANNLENMHKVMKFDLQQNEWTELLQYNAISFAMVPLANQLTLVGGWDLVKRKSINQIALSTTGGWTSPYPPMNTARSCLTAVCFNNYVIVVGGFGDRGYTSSVELLDVEARRWYIVESLPNPRKELKSAKIGNTLYLMEGYDHTGLTKVVHKVHLNKLITKTISKKATPTLWQVISDTPLKCSAPLNVGSSLLTVGGHDDHDNASSFIHLYQPDTRKWVKVGDLPTARCNCTCSVLPSGDVIVAGGWDACTGFSSTVYFLSISNAY